jgi:hypothetical protein
MAAISEQWMPADFNETSQRLNSIVLVVKFLTHFQAFKATSFCSCNGYLWKVGVLDLIG